MRYVTRKDITNEFEGSLEEVIAKLEAYLAEGWQYLEIETGDPADYDENIFIFLCKDDSE